MCFSITSTTLIREEGEGEIAHHIIESNIHVIQLLQLKAKRIYQCNNTEKIK
jgi:hypothetical protein